MKHRLLMLAYAALCAFILHQLALGCVLFAHSLSTAHAMTCEWPGVPFEAMDGCRMGLAMSAWGVE